MIPLLHTGGNLNTMGERQSGGDGECNAFGLEPDFDPSELDRITIGELDLAAVCRAYRIIRTFFNLSLQNSGEGGDESSEELRMKMAEYMTCEGPTKNERELALRMVFEEDLDAPRREKVAKLYLDRLGLAEEDDDENEQQEEYTQIPLRDTRTIVG